MQTDCHIIRKCICSRRGEWPLGQPSPSPYRQENVPALKCSRQAVWLEWAHFKGVHKSYCHASQGRPPPPHPSTTYPFLFSPCRPPVSVQTLCLCTLLDLIRQPLLWALTFSQSAGMVRFDIAVTRQRAGHVEIKHGRTELQGEHWSGSGRCEHVLT